MQLEVAVQCFGILQQVCGGRERKVAVAALPATVEHVLDGLADEVPEVRAYLAYTACAIGDRIVGRDAHVEAGDTLVLLPPVSGG